MCATICARVGFGFFGERVGAEDHARRAEAALEAEVLHEGLLERMQPPALRQALDGDDPLAFDLADRRRAGPHRFVDQHRAGAAEGLAAAELGAGSLLTAPSLKDGDVGSNATSSHLTEMRSALPFQLLRCSFPQP